MEVSERCMEGGREGKMDGRIGWKVDGNDGRKKVMDGKMDG